MSSPGIDLSRLSGALKPSRVVTAADLATAGIRVPAFYKGDLFCPVGKTPLYLGQPLALLIFEQFDAFDQARLALRDPSCVNYGKETGPVAGRALRLASLRARRRRDARCAGCLFADAGRLGGAAQFPERRHSGLGAGQPAGHRPTRRPRSTASRSAPGSPRTIRTNWCSTASSRRNPIDPMFLEPEGGIAWYDGRGKSARARGRRAVAAGGRGVGRLSARRRARRLQAGADPHAFRASRRRLRRPRSHDHAALHRARRDVLSRIVRCGSRTTATSSSSPASSGMRSRCARASASTARPARSRAFAADHVLDGGGLANFSANVADVGATGAIGIYDIPKVDVTTVAVHSRGVTAGSMRGYGTLQTMTALEVLIDEAATALRLDPIEFRRRNALAHRRQDHGRQSAGRRHAHRRNSRQARRASDLERSRRRESPQAARAGGHSRRHRRGLRHQGFRQRRRQHVVRRSRSRPRAGSRSTPMRSRWAPPSARRSPIASPRSSAAWPTRSTMAKVDAFAPLGLVTSGDPYTHRRRQRRMPHRATRAGCR